ncbi:MAG: AEC family transporter, partial [Azospirillaceae bacterium]
AALFTLGIVLSAPGEPAAGRSDWAMPAVAALMRLAAMPLLAWAIIQGWLASDPLWAAPALLVAAGPSGAMPMVIGLQYGVRTTAVARAVLLSTLGALATLSVVAGL